MERASAGYAVATTAGTVAEGESREHSSTVKASDTSPLPGSLESLADLIAATGQRCLQHADQPQLGHLRQPSCRASVAPHSGHATL